MCIFSMCTCCIATISPAQRNYGLYISLLYEHVVSPQHHFLKITIWSMYFFPIAIISSAQLNYGLCNFSYINLLHYYNITFGCLAWPGGQPWQTARWCGGPWGGAVVSLNSRGEYFRPRIMQYKLVKKFNVVVGGGVGVESNFSVHLYSKPQD